MSYLLCGNCQHRHEPFGKIAVFDDSIEMLAQLPFEERGGIGNDNNQPICVVGSPGAAINAEYRRLAGIVWDKISQ